MSLTRLCIPDFITLWAQNHLQTTPGSYNVVIYHQLLTIICRRKFLKNSVILIMWPYKRSKINGTVFQSLFLMHAKYIMKSLKNENDKPVAKHKWTVFSYTSRSDMFNYKFTWFYYPPRDVFALNTGKYRPGCIFFVYTGAPVLWILSVINFRFFNNISESM